MRPISPASSAVRGTTLVEVEPLVDRVVVAADRAQAVEGREPERRGGVRVGRPAGGGVAAARSRARRRSPTARATSRAEASVFSIGGWPAMRQSSTAHAGTVGVAASRSTSAAAASNASARGGAQVDVQLASLGDDVGPRAAVDDARR